MDNKILADLYAREMQGKIYRHFKGVNYIVTDVATSAENGDEGRLVVVYMKVGAGDMYVRPLEEFLSPVDRKKYPDAEQRMRFERV